MNYLSAFLLLIGIVGCTADLPICVRGGVACTAEQIGTCTSERGYCCVYPLPVSNSTRCICKPGYGGRDCDITLNDPDWLEHGQDDLKKQLENFKKINNGVAKNVILFLGDGMGMSTVTASRIYKGQQEGRSGETESFSFEEFPFTGLSKTFIANHQVTDSAGAATSMLGGQKVSYATVGVNSKVIRFDCQSSPGNEIDTILTWSQAEGKRTGVVSNTRVTHASPAATYAHSAERYWECDSDFQDQWGNNWTDLAAREYNCTDIAHQFVHQKPGQDINVMMGGGRAKFLPKTMNDFEYTSKLGSRSDGRNLIQEWIDLKQDEKASFVWNKTAFDAVDAENTDYLFAMFERSHMRYNYDRKNDGAGEPSLAEMVKKAISVLSNGDKGFFLMVEGGRIDHGHHDGKAQIALDETIQFDEAIKAAMEMTDEKDTLITVSADHSHVFTMGGYSGRGNDILGILDTVDVEPSLDGKPRTTLQYGDGIGAPDVGEVRSDPRNADLHDWNYRQQAHILTVEESHGGEDVAIYARGPMAHLFTGVHDQTYIAHVMAYASCVGANKEHCTGKDNPTPEPCPSAAAGVTSSAGHVVLFTAAAAIVIGRRWVN